MSCYLINHEEYADLANYLITEPHLTYTDGFDKTVLINDKRYFVNSAAYGPKHNGHLFSWNLALELAVQNIRSCETRYPNKGPAGGFLVVSVDEWLTTVEETTKKKEGKKTTYYPQDLKHFAEMIDSMEYQSCETDDYYETHAYKLLEQARRILLKDALKALD
jgi:hypothetical protein